MDRELIERLAKEAGRGNMAKFAALIAEECAKVCEDQLPDVEGCSVFVPWEARLIGEHDRATRSAAAIREKFSV